MLTIAGSDSGGGAGIQADLKAFARCGVHGTSAITAITAQNTLAVSAVHQVPPEMVLAQVRAVLSDIGVDAVKVGILGTADVALAVAQALDELPAGTPVVVDPVMVAESGARLLDREAQEVLIRELLPRASVLTPNLPEARVLVARDLHRAANSLDSVEPVPQGKDEEAEAEALARAVLALGPRAVVLTGGHRARAVDLFVESAYDGSGERVGRVNRGEHRGERGNRGERVNRGEHADRVERVVRIEGERHPDGAAHGSGCTHSSVLASQLALGRTPLDAARLARALAGAAVARGLREIGAGAGPVDVLDLERMRAG